MQIGPGQYRKLLRRWDGYGEARFLTFSCFDRRPFFSSTRACEWFLASLERARAKHRFHLWGWVLMPEHVHLLIWPGQESVADILKSLKLSVASKAITWTRRHKPHLLCRMQGRQPGGAVKCHFWERGGGYDRNLRSARDIHEKLRYIHNNAVQRGLAPVAEDYPWSSARAYRTGEPVPISLDSFSMPVAVNFE